MATKKRAQLVAGLLEGRRTAPAATLHALPVEPREPLVEGGPVDGPQSAPSRRHAAVKGAKRCGDLSAVPIAAREAIPITAGALFHQKGSATAAIAMNTAAIPIIECMKATISGILVIGTRRAIVAPIEPRAGRTSRQRKRRRAALLWSAAARRLN